MPEFSNNLWAPWRMQYIQSLSGPAEDGCFLCRYAARPEQDAEHHVIWRRKRCLATFNTFPYSNGHLLIAPLEHIADFDRLDDDTLLEILHAVADAKRLLQETTRAQGFNVGMNFGRCAGAGLPGHLHVHVVPRWEGDSNFMAVIGNVRVISQAIADLHQKMREVAPTLGLPPLTA